MAVRIGVLALQGAFREHVQVLAGYDAEVCEIRTPSDLEGLRGIVLPGGESTVMGKLLLEEGLLHPLAQLCASGIPVLATCAGMILLARNLPGFSEQPRLGLMDIAVLRNAFGRQKESFATRLHVREFSRQANDLIEAVFIRAPVVASCGPEVNVLASLQGNPVAVRQDNLLALSFHPELSCDTRFHGWLVRRAQEHKAAMHSV